MVLEKKIIIIGGGAAGLMSAIIAARNGATVIILERMNRVGKKILATGNGRCNITNTNTTIQRYHGENPKFIYGPLGQFDVKSTMQFFEELGIWNKIEEEGKVYPFSDQASSVLDVLRDEAERLGIEEYCEAEVEEIIPRKKGFVVALKNNKKVYGDRVVITTGGSASPNLGSNGSGYKLARNLGHKIIAPFPALVQLRLDASFLKRLKGTKFNGVASILVEDRIMQSEEGEILFTDYGISGPPILQLSRQASEGIQRNHKVDIQLDMIPDQDESQLDLLLQTRFGYKPTKTVEFSFVGLINKRLIPVVLKQSGIKDLQKPCSEVTVNERTSIVKRMKRWRVPVIGTQSWMQAQVTAGGINTGDIDPKTMESKLVPGVYFAGEVVDIDGDCGGFNLQWAWSSGYVAGYSAAAE